MRLIHRALSLVTADAETPDCIRRPPPAPPLLGRLDVLTVFGNPQPHGNSPSFAIVIMSLVLMTLAYRVTRSQLATSLPQYSVVRYAIGLYCSITGAFFLLLSTNLNIIVVVAATLHNFIEWTILAHLLLPPHLRKRGNAMAGAFCWTVALVVMQIPDILIAFEAEEVTGIWPDFFLLLTATFLACVPTPNMPRRPVYLFYLEGAAWHMIQIITLLLQGFGYLAPAPAGVLTFVSALPNYWFYSEFALYYDGCTEQPAFPRLLSPLIVRVVDFFTGVRRDPIPVGEVDYDFLAINSLPVVTKTRQQQDVFDTPPHAYASTRTLKLLLIMAFGLSTLFVVGPPLNSKLCPDVGFTCLDPTEHVWQATLVPPSVTAKDVRTDVSVRSAAPQNLETRWFAGTGEMRGFHLIIEKWTSRAALVVANRAAPLELTPVFRFHNFKQVETTNTFFDSCNDTDVVRKFGVVTTGKSKRVFAASDPTQSSYAAGHDECVAKTAGEAGTVTGLTMARLKEGTLLTYGVNALAYGLRARFEPGSLTYNVFFGGDDDVDDAVVGASIFKSSLRGVSGTNAFDSAEAGGGTLVMVVEKWASAEALTKHLQTPWVEFIRAAAAVSTVPASVIMSSPFVEVVC